MALTWAQALGWRLQQQLLDPVGTGSVADVVRRLGAVPAWPDATPELAVGMRRAGGQYGDAARALAAKEVVKVFAYRGALHLMAPEDAGDHLALRASSRMWERPSGKGLGVGRRHLTRWLGELSEQHLTAVTVEGDEVLVLRDDLDELQSARPSDVVRLLPGRDPWVMAPGTSDACVVPLARREVVSRSANLIVRGGVVAGTWTLRGGHLAVKWFDESGPVPEPDVGAAAGQLADHLGRPLDLVLQAG